MRINLTIARTASIDHAVTIGEAATILSNDLKSKVIKCQNEESKLSKAYVAIRWASPDPANGSDMWRVNLEDEPSKADLRGKRKRKETKKNVGSVIAVCIEPDNGVGLKGKDIVSMIEEQFGLSSGSTPELLTDVTFLVQRPGWSSGYGYRIPRAIFDDGLVE